MKKFFFIALCAISLVNTAQAQTSAAQTRTSAGGAITNNSTEFKQQADNMKAALNANDLTKARSLFDPVYRMMAKRGDEIRKVNGDNLGADKRYAMVGKLKDLIQDISGNKAALLQLMDEMKANY